MELQCECSSKKLELRRKYAEERNPVKVGDIVTDHYHTIKVECSSVTGHQVPYKVYYGIELAKNGEPKKHQPCPSNPVYQTEVVTINGQPYTYVKEDFEM